MVGNTPEEIFNAAGIFLGTNLGLEGVIDKSVIDDISRAAEPSGPGARDEVLVRFRDSASRDRVMGCAAKLAPFIDAEGKPTAGLRIEVPLHLRPTFKLLFRYGQTLRTRHGPGTRRHVKFDDHLRSLYLNVKLPGDENWSRVSAEVARRGLATKDVASNAALERRLDIGGPPCNRVRAASVAEPPVAGNQRSAWSTRRTASLSSS